MRGRTPWSCSGFTTGETRIRWEWWGLWCPEKYARLAGHDHPVSMVNHDHISERKHQRTMSRNNNINSLTCWWYFSTLPILFDSWHPRSTAIKQTTLNREIKRTYNDDDGEEKDDDDCCYHHSYHYYYYNPLYYISALKLWIVSLSL